jgi:hypothetical protein
VSYVSVLNDYGRFARGVAAGWIEEPVSVDSPNHAQMLVRFGNRTAATLLRLATRDLVTAHRF